MEWIRERDFLSPKVCLFFNGQTRFFSSVGLVMTILFFVEVIGFGIYFFVQYLNGEQTSLTYSKDLGKKNITGNLSKKVFFYVLKDQDGQVVSPKILKAVPTYWSVNKEDSTVEHLIEDNCREKNTHFELEGFNQSEYKCIYRPNGEDIILSTYLPESYSRYLNIYFARCNNETDEENENSCYPEEKIDEILSTKNIYLYLYSETYSIDNDKKNPILTNLFTEHIPVIPDLIYVYYYNMRLITYESDDGILVSQKNTYTDFGIDPSVRNINLFPKTKSFYVDKLVLVTQFSMDTTYTEAYKRSYQKLQSLAANIGGIATIGYFISEIVTILFCRGSVIFAISESATKGNPKFTFNYVSMKDNNLSKFKNNNYLRSKTGCNIISTDLGTSTNAEPKQKKNLKFIEILFYKCWKKRENCIYLRNCEKAVKKYLDIKNIITLWKELESFSLNTFTPQKNNSNFSTVELLQKTKNFGHLLLKRKSAECHSIDNNMKDEEP